MNIFPIQRFRVSGNSMLPTLKPGQDVLVFNWAYIFSKPKKGDIVVIRKNGKDMVKHIQNVQGYKCFVEGDNKQVCRCCGKEESTDSRSFGPVDRSEIIGKVIFIITRKPRFLKAGFNCQVITHFRGIGVNLSSGFLVSCKLERRKPRAFSPRKFIMQKNMR